MKKYRDLIGPGVFFIFLMVMAIFMLADSKGFAAPPVPVKNYIITQECIGNKLFIVAQASNSSGPVSIVQVLEKHYYGTQPKY